MTPPTLHLIRDGALAGADNMARDEYLLHCDAVRPAALRIYGWNPPTISLGYFQPIAAIAQLSPELQQLDVVRRATGGGAILHDREITYCLTIDHSLPAGRAAPAELYRLVHTCWRDVLAVDGLHSELAPDEFPFPSPRSGPFFCFQKPGRTDLIIGAEKLLGSAQRRLPGRVLQHGSLLLGRRFAEHPGVDLHDPQPSRVEQWIAQFVTQLAQRLELAPVAWTWPDDAAADIARRRAHHLSDAWKRLR